MAFSVANLSRSRPSMTSNPSRFRAAAMSAASLAGFASFGHVLVGRIADHQRHALLRRQRGDGRLRRLTVGG